LGNLLPNDFDIDYHEIVDDFLAFLALKLIFLHADG